MVAGIDMLHVPYKGATPAVTDVIAGQVTLFCGNLPPAIPHIRSGTLRALGVTTLKRSPELPDVPTIAETYPGFESVAWFGYYAPKGTPQELVPEVLHRTVRGDADARRPPEAHFAGHRARGRAARGVPQFHGGRDREVDEGGDSREGPALSETALRIGITRDFLTTQGERSFDIVAWQRLCALPDIEVEFLAAPATSPLTCDDVSRFDVLVTKRNPLEKDTLDVPGLRLRLLVRNGVGFDHIDVPACTRAGVIVCTTPGAVARPVASAIMAMMLAFSHELFPRDAAARAGRWSERWNRPGMALTGRTLGVVGLGNIGCELLRLAAPWGMRHLSHTPRFDAELHDALNVEPVDLDTLLGQSDFVALCCPLNERTRGLVDARRLARMRPHAYLINTARGEVVDEAALVAALAERRIAGAGIDVYETEPPRPDHPLFALDNVIVGSHNLAYTDTLNRDSNRSVVDAVCRLHAGKRPRHVLDPSVFDHGRVKSLADDSGAK